MRFFITFLFAVFAFSFLSFPLVYAEEVLSDAPSTVVDEQEKILTLDEAKAMLDALPTAKDAIGGSLKESEQPPYYDIHGRQLAYREHAKVFRASLEERRKRYESPRLDILERARTTVRKVYAAETAAYQKEVLEAEDESVSEEGSEQTSESEDVDDGVLTRKPVSSVDGTNKKVITSGDAPDFDPSQL